MGTSCLSCLSCIHRFLVGPLHLCSRWGGLGTILISSHVLNPNEHNCSFSKLLHSQGWAHGQLVDEWSWPKGGHHVC